MLIVGRGRDFGVVCILFLGWIGNIVVVLCVFLWGYGMGAADIWPHGEVGGNATVFLEVSL